MLDPIIERCSHPECDQPATDVRGGFAFCRTCFFLVLTWEQAA